MNVMATHAGAPFDWDTFFKRVEYAQTRVLMLDYDGTLAPLRLDPAEAVPYPGVVSLLDAIMENPRTRLVIVSGRWIKDLLPLLHLKRLPEIWGSHGWERRQVSGEYVSRRIDVGTLELLVTADEWAPEFERLGARIERKPASIAFHWRGCANHQIAEIRSRLLEKWLELGRVKELVWHDFDQGIELRAEGCDKGEVVRTLEAEAGPDAIYAYLGDDMTDEDAFRAMPNHGLSALVRPQFRPTAANLWLRPPEELIHFLTQWHEKSSV